jgi:hypothetical protein
MSPRFLLTVAAAALLSIPGTGAAAGGTPLHDFDATTLASYVNLRFSSAVPPNVIRQVLAGEGFSQADLDLIAASPSTPAPGRPSTDVGPPGVSSVQQISQDPLACPSSDPIPCELDTETEPDIAVNPASSGNLVGVFQQGRFPNGGAVDIGWATSFDGGKTWPYKGSAPGLTVAVTPRPTAGPGAPFARASDPVVAFDRKHKNVYLNGISVSDAGCAVFCDSADTVNISNNQGQTFGPPVVVHEDLFTPDQMPVVFNDKNWIVADNNPSSPFYGRTYAAWDQVRCADNGCNVITAQPVVLSYSDDGGKTWSPLIQATHEPDAPAHQDVGVQPVVLPNGDVVIVYVDAQAGAYTFAGSYKAIRSNDGGKTWSDPMLITAANPFAEEGNSLRAPNVPSAAVAGSTIYVAFQDQGIGLGKNDILLTSSANEGQTWTTPVDVTPGELVDHFTPAIAVVGGPAPTVHLTYRTHAPTNVNVDPFVDAVYRRVTAGGATTFGPQVLATSDASVAAFTTVASTVPFKFFGDYAGIAASSISAHPIWDQSQTFPDQHSNATNTHQRSFSARIQ